MLTLLFALAAVAADDPLPIRQPTEKWVVNFDAAQCRAQRNYGTHDQPLLLIIKQPPLGDTIQLAFVQKKSGGDGVDDSATLKFDSLAPFRVSILMFEPRSAKVRTHSVNLPAAAFLPARSAATLTIRAPGLKESLALSDMAKLMRVMDECVADLKKVWNVTENPVERSDPGNGVVGTMKGLIKPEDYPWESVMEGGSGTVKVALLVDEGGRVADCSVIESSKVALLDGQTCAILRERARFTPATDAAGKKVKGSFLQRITWRVQ